MLKWYVYGLSYLASIFITLAIYILLRLKTEVIYQFYSNAYIAQQNGLIQRKHSHISELGLTLLAQSNMPLKFWDEAFYATTYLINRILIIMLGFKSTFEMRTKHPPDYLSLKVFGCTCFSHIKPYHNHKFDFKTKPCTFLGDSHVHKIYKCLILSGKVIISMSVIFDEKKSHLLNLYLLYQVH